MKAMLATVLFALLCAGLATAVDLPAPRKSGGPDLLTAIDNRASAPSSAFTEQPLTRQELSTILWAATGHNRNGRLWTVPMAMGRPPYCKIYVIEKAGTFLYNWETHALDQVTTKDLTKVIPAQAFAQNAGTNLIVVTDGRELSDMNSPYGEEMSHVLAGAISQNVYLAAQADGILPRLIYSIDREAATRELGLASGDKPLFSIVLGRK